MWKMKISIKRVALMLAVALGIIAVVISTRPPGVMRMVHKMEGKKTVEDRITEYGPAARKRLHSIFDDRGMQYPPKKLVFVGLKKENVLQVYADSGDGKFCFIKAYPIQAASGRLGPKLKEGDMQVPEGIYKVVFLNPNSLYHLSLRLNYPNEFDLEMAKKDGRTQPGKDIMIHGDTCSVGCLAMGDPVSEDLFVLAADTGMKNIKVILSPVDFRKRQFDTTGLDLPEWSDNLYSVISKELKALPLP
jgi:hypothetical protein